MNDRRNCNGRARLAWILFGGLITAGLVALTLRELPSMRRELHLMRM